MRYASLDLASGLPSARSQSSRPYRYGREAHLAAVKREAMKPASAAPPPSPCGRADYLLGFAVRFELRQRGLLVGAPGRRRVAA